MNEHATVTASLYISLYIYVYKFAGAPPQVEALPLFQGCIYDLNEG